MNNAGWMKLRETKFVAGEVEAVRLDGAFTGFAAVFETVDLGNDLIARGAFAKSLARRGPGNIRMLFQHDPDEPIGVWEKIEETRHGLKVSGRITASVTRGREILELMRAGAVDGLSIGFRTLRARNDPVTQARRILEADLWEISVVTFPMQEQARIDSVKGRWKPARPTIRDLERWLVKDAGLSRRDARALVARGYRNAFGARDAAGALSTDHDLAARFAAAAGQIRTHATRN